MSVQRPLLAVLIVLAGATSRAPAQTSFPWPDMARRIVSALQIDRGERVLLRFDPETMRELEPELAKQLRAAGAVVTAHAFGPMDGFAQRLEETDVYVWLPAGPTAQTPPDQAAALVSWLDARPERRELHFHWVDGTRDADGLPVAHRPAYDRVYLDALDIDYAAMAAQMDAVTARLRAGEGARDHARGHRRQVPDWRSSGQPPNRRCIENERPQWADPHRSSYGAARRRHARRATRTEREWRHRVARRRFFGTSATNVRMEIRSGVVTESSATTGADAVKAFLASQPGASRFREFALGFNPKLTIPTGEQALPYYGYGAGVVRMSLGDNNELGGDVRGGGIRWLFFPDATVVTDGVTIVDRGRLVQPLTK